MADETTKRDEPVEDGEIADQDLDGVAGGKFGPNLIPRRQVPGSLRPEPAIGKKPPNLVGIVHPNC